MLWIKSGDKVQLNTEVSELRWLEEEEKWEATISLLVPGTGDLTARERQARKTAGGEKAIYVSKETIRAKVVISAVGKLVEPKAWPENVPGIEEFAGQIIHTARWDPDIDLKGKDVIVVGTGCSAAQVVPELIKPHINAKSVTQLMRSPPWVFPDIFSADNLQRWERYMPWLLRYIPGLVQIVRLVMFLVTELGYLRFFSSVPLVDGQRTRLEEKLLTYMKTAVPKKYHETLTPHYQVGCKRRVIDAEWFRSLQHPNVELSALPLKRVEKDAVILEKASDEETRLHADVIILANGYETTSLLHPLSVKGRGGKDLHELWNERGGPQAYLGLAIDKFPNFFLVFGPNTSVGHTSVLIDIENAVNYSLNFIRPIINGEISTYEVKEEACRVWTDEVQTASKRTVWMSGGCRNWYVTENEWNTMIYP